MEEKKKRRSSFKKKLEEAKALHQDGSEGKKTLTNKDVEEVRQNVSDVEVYGNGDLFQLLAKASSKEEGWMKSTKAMPVRNGCVVQVTTQQGDNIAEALTYVPNVKIMTDSAGNKYLG